jgi:ribosome-binding ATPase YchF (GTP1/OBG family)
VRDIAIITAELIAKDLEEMCKRLERLTSKLYRSMTLAQSAQQSRELAILLKAYEWLVSGHCLRHCVWTEAEHAFLSTLQMWTSKPTCFLVNMSARDYADPAARAAQCAAVLAWTAEHSPDSAVVPISVRYEQAALQCPPEASTAFVTDVAERIVAVAAAAAAERAAKASADSAAKNKVDKKDKKDKKEVRSLVEGSSKGSSKGSNKGSEKNDKKDKKDKKESSSSRKSSLGGTDKPAATAGAAAAEDNPDALAASAAAAAAAAAAAVGADAIPTAAPAVPRNEIASLCTLAERPPAAARAPWGAAAWACALGTVWLQPAPSPEPTAAVSAQAAGASAGASRPVGGHGAVDVEDHDVTHAAARGLKPSASSALYGLIDAGYNAWSMVRVYLIDGDRAEVKAFLVRRGTEAQAVSALLYYDNPQHCTGVHVYPWDAFVRAGHSLDQMRKNNTRLVKTRTYPVQEGDILQFVIKPE